MLTPLILPVSSLYSELHDLTAFDHVAPKRLGSFSVKEISGRRYWYHQRWVGPKRIQKIIGVETPDLLRQIESWKSESTDWRRQQERRRQLVRSLKAASHMRTDRISAQVIKRLSEAGAFEAGAVLIGTHAYMTYGPMLGMRLAESNLRTGDIDFGAVDVDVAVGSDAVSFPEAVKAADEAFLIVPARPGATISTALKYKGGEARVELLTPLDKGKAWTPKVIRALGFGAQKTPFLDYLIEHPVEATYLADAGVRVRVPDPARFALHKLIVAANRDVGSQVKAMKDKSQSAELINVLTDLRPKDLELAAKRLQKLGTKYISKAKATAGTLDKEMKTRVLSLLQTG